MKQLSNSVAGLAARCLGFGADSWPEQRRGIHSLYARLCKVLAASVGENETERGTMRFNEGVAMSPVLILSHSGRDGKLHLEVPVERPNADVEVMVRPKQSAGDAWPPGYFDLFGSITDDAFVRPPQGEMS